jgi:hypothetical protein
VIKKRIGNKFAENGVDKLNKEQRIQLANWFVEKYSTTEISELIKEKYNIKVTRQNVWAYSQRPKWKKLINRLRNRFEKNILKLPLTNKSERIKELVRLYREETNKRDKRSILCQIQEEIEGKRGVINNFDNSTHNYKINIIDIMNKAAEADKEEVPKDILSRGMGVLE